jgi:alpha-D-ribose 1-methylphosphonate 5-triphosphate diphosphatase PhnM
MERNLVGGGGLTAQKAARRVDELIAERDAYLPALEQNLARLGSLALAALASDYLPSGLLASAFALARNGLVTLAAGIGLVTSGAAAAAGLSDRGRLTPGLRADLALVDDSASWPVVRATFRGLSPG